MSLATFTRSFLETALWSTTDEEGTPLDAHHSIADFAPETLAELETDCVSFYADNVALWKGNTDERAGHDFWLTRCRHGAGFWDGDYERGDLLTLESGAYGNVDLTVGDDGLIYC
jgi:hypothetical protein